MNDTTATRPGKTAIILIGGGMRSAHGGGFLYALATSLGITNPDIMIGSSGDAGNVLYFAAGQYESSKHIWTELLPYSRLVSPFRFWRMLDVDYLIDTVFKVRDRLDIEKARQSPIEWFISATDYDTGESRYVSKHDDVSPFEALRASKAAPVFFGKRVMLSGHRYIDGELGPTIGDHVRFAITKGADRIVVVSHSAPYSLRHQFMMRAYSLFVSPPMRRALIRDISANETDLTTPDATVLSVIPGELPASFATRDPDKLAATFERGIQDALAREQELRTLFGT